MQAAQQGPKSAAGRAVARTTTPKDALRHTATAKKRDQQAIWTHDFDFDGLEHRLQLADVARIAAFAVRLSAWDARQPKDEKRARQAQSREENSGTEREAEQG